MMKPIDQGQIPSFREPAPVPVSLDVVARGLSLALSVAMIAALVLVPGILTRGDVLLSRAVLPVLLLGVAGGLAYGLGYRPRSPLLGAMLGPFVSWPLMASAMTFLVLAADV